MNLTKSVLLTACSVMIGQAALAAEVDTSKWVCKFCPEQTGTEGTVELGLESAANANYRYGDFSGVDDGANLRLGADIRYRDPDSARYADAQLRDLGLDAWGAGLRGGVQGQVRGTLDWQQVPRQLHGGAQTPYLGVGSDALTLPGGWVSGPATGALPGLGAALRPVEIEQQRQVLEVGVAVTPDAHWEYTLRHRRIDRDGLKAGGGALFLSASQLLEPVDHQTDEIEAAVGYTGRQGSWRIGYLGSFFDNAHQRLRWDSPFDAQTPGATAGELALAPDNRFHQFSLGGAYRLSAATRLKADLALGRMTQDEAFVDATVNGVLGAPALPRASLDGRVDTLDATLRLTHQVNDRLGLLADYRRNERDNRTPQAAFPYIVTDMYAGTLRTNLPYSYTDDTARLVADYRLNASSALEFGAGRQERERTHQEVGETAENTFWAAISSKPRTELEGRLRVEHVHRNGVALVAVDELSPPQNPLLRKFNVADRERDRVAGQLAWYPSDALSINLSAEAANDDYFRSTLGLTDGRQRQIGIDLGYAFAEGWSAHAFAGRERIDSTLVGSQSFAGPGWRTEVRDVIDAFGAGLRYADSGGRWSAGADYSLSRGRSEIRASGTPFPDISTRLWRLSVHADYRISDALSLRGALLHERYTSADWHDDGLAPDSVSSMLSLGDADPDYRVNAVRATLQYRF